MNPHLNTPHPDDDPLARGLAALTAPAAPPRDVLADALAASRADRVKSRRFPRHVPVLRTVIALAACCAIGVFGLITTSPQSDHETDRAFLDLMINNGSVATSIEPMAAMLLDASISPPVAPPSPTLSTQRHVIQKAYIELLVPDVRTAFQKSTLLISEARTEFYTDASITGEDDSARASLTLRVTPDRLSIVLQSLRDLGIVFSESLSGEDVTDQLLDLDARLRNEQRVETELLELLDARKDAPLKDILDLRQAIGSVRESIERLKAQQASVSRLVSLVTILVVIRSDASRPHIEPTGGVWSMFTHRLSTGWTSGLYSLASFSGNAVRFLVAGLPLWILLAVLIPVARVLQQAWKRRKAKEPAPLS
jgi:hypothetical protein